MKMTTQPMAPSKAPSPLRVSVPAQYGVVQRKCACGGSSGREGECEDCKQKGTSLQRRSTSGITPNAVPAIVHQVLRSPGQPLDPVTRAFMEPRFGHDFARVRVHTDAQAADSARAVNALAYTAGPHIAFAPGRYAPHAPDGQALLAHELVHVIQQHAGPNGLPTRVAAPSEAAETEAESLAQSIQRKGPAPVVRRVPQPLTLSRYEGVPPPPEVEMEVEEEEAETQEEVGPVHKPRTTADRGTPLIPAPAGRALHQPVTQTVPHTFAGMKRRADIQVGREYDQDAATRDNEVPTAVLTRGGTPQNDFVEVVGSGVAPSMSGPVRYRKRIFHILDALDYDVSRVSDEFGFIGVYRAYFPDSTIPLVKQGFVPLPDTDAMRGTVIADLAFREGIRFDPHELDPAGVARMKVYLSSARRRCRQLPNGEALLQKIATGPTEAPSTQSDPNAAGPCLQKEVPRASSGTAYSNQHNEFAEHVTGSKLDYLVQPPGLPACQTDGRDKNDPALVWEVKTGHEWATDYGLYGSIFAEVINKERIMKLEEQRARCVEAARRCGLKYAYAFNVREVADFVRRLWGNNPPVYYREWSSK